MIFQSIVRTLYPPQCGLCEAQTDVDHALCGACWRDVHFLDNSGCRKCGVPLLGGTNGHSLCCDDCMKVDRPWVAGAAAIVYRDGGRRIVLSLKHGDRTDLARVCAPWLVRAGEPFLADDTVVVPVPLHRSRLRHRKYNQSALLVQEIQRVTSVEICLDALERVKRTDALEGASQDERYSRLDGAIIPHPKNSSRLRDRNIVLVDDVMTSGATLTASANACLAAGAKDIFVLSLARAVKDA